MQITDAIADMLTRIRNAGNAGHEMCEIPASKIKCSIADILVDEGYVTKYKVKEDNKQNTIIVTLKYFQGKHAVTGIKRISKPGLRVYTDSKNMPKVLGGLGIAIVSTNKGIMTEKKAVKENVGGEVLAYVW